MRRKNSIKKRLTLLYGGLVTATITVFGVYAYFAFSAIVKKNLDESLAKFASELEQAVSIESDLRREKTAEYSREDLLGSEVINPKNYYYVVADASGHIVNSTDKFKSESFRDNFFDSAISKNDSEDSEGARSEFSDVKLNGEKLRIYFLNTEQVVIVSGFSYDEISARQNIILKRLALALPFAAILSVVIGAALADVSLKPVSIMTEAARELSLKRLSGRLPVPDTEDEISRLAATLNNMIERLEKSYKGSKRFTSDVSHELKTPLTILRGELEIALHKRRTPESYERTIASALEETARLSNLIESMLELSRAENDSFELNVTSENLSGFIEDIAEDAEILAEPKNISVTKDIQKDLVLEFDIYRLHQAALNIVENAVKYTDPGGNIEVKLFRNGETVSFVVNDDGQGISEEELPLIFDRFYRADKSRNRERRGFGLGLSIANRIVESHGGEIIARSRIGEGSSFEIKLPLRDESRIESLPND